MILNLITYEVVYQTELKIFSTLKTVTASSSKRRYFPYQTTRCYIQLTLHIILK
jgi:hypothetical protein